MTVKMVQNKEKGMVNPPSWASDEDGNWVYMSFKAVYCDEIIEIVKAAGAITGKKNRERAGIILQILEQVEKRMREGSCNGSTCPKYKECFRNG